MNSLFPVMLDLRGWPCAVLGGGPMAEEKVRLLEETGARLVLISEEATPTLRARAGEGALEWRRRRPVPEDVRGFRLVISALGDPAANAAFAEAAEVAGVLFNAADDPPRCRFLLPSVHRQGSLVIAVSTGGKCPALAVRIREKLADLFDQAYADFLDLAAEFRPSISSQIRDFAARKKLWYRIADSPALELLRRGRRSEARTVIEKLIFSQKENAA
ncbi:MAG: precorrin-2 dehydrogenase/sirohydrochlorin ferrochelatase family protein [Bryobacteraceae bacterium]